MILLSLNFHVHVIIDSCFLCILHDMYFSKYLRCVYWCLPFCCYSIDANAWGLVTHLYFAQSLLWAMPLLDPRLQNAIKRFPELVMAGACLPDLAIVSRRFRYTHLWENAHQLLMRANSDEEIAIAIGYASHLYVDVIAHNHFVPAHEAHWHENNMMTHIASEWAMDAHLMPLLDTTPRVLLTCHHNAIIAFIAPHFKCSESKAASALKRLAFWDGVLRAVKLPAFIYHTARLFDKRLHLHFVYYIAKTQVAIGNIGNVLNGNRPVLSPELQYNAVHERDAWRTQCLSDLKLLQPHPVQYFNDYTVAEYRQSA